MTESDRELIRRVLDGQDALRESVSQVHVLAAETRAQMGGVAKRQEDFISAHASFVDEIEDRTANHSERIDATALQVHEWETKKILVDAAVAQVNAWKAQKDLVLWAASFVGIGGLASMVAILLKLSH